MPTLSVLVDREFVRDVDAVLQKTRIYSSRSEFIKDAIRERMIELSKTADELRNIREATKKLARLAVKRGYKGEPLTRKERIRIANEHLMEYGFEPHQEK
ncbi:MAG: hypothetical protein J4415_01385 [Candidatus Diapherotrites archaeon]|uniref:Ribbon-helix-helix protein CopG domain-containing protein n=1 Tax=Candidatus Iainarchaeum sp. TaxID=3101447 RepID=A0A8T4KUQ4_9ARCH|nr:hypothetical protein [Candidatus Diapherotrites archaeon]